MGFDTQRNIDEIKEALLITENEVLSDISHALPQEVQNSNLIYESHEMILMRLLKSIGESVVLSYNDSEIASFTLPFALATCRQKKYLIVYKDEMTKNILVFIPDELNKFQSEEALEKIFFQSSYIYSGLYIDPISKKWVPIEDNAEKNFENYVTIVEKIQENSLKRGGLNNG